MGPSSTPPCVISRTIASSIFCPVDNSRPRGTPLTYKLESGVFGTCPMRSCLQIEDAMLLRETVSKALGHFQRFSQIFEVKNPKS
jgi:hypothetical protein